MIKLHKKRIGSVPVFEISMVRYLDLVNESFISVFKRRNVLLPFHSRWKSSFFA